jgi:hypothetical protein
MKTILLIAMLLLSGLAQASSVSKSVLCQDENGEVLFQGTVQQDDTFSGVFLYDKADGLHGTHQLNCFVKVNKLSNPPPCHGRRICDTLE